MKDYICYHNGMFKRESEICISFRDLGFQRAYAVFDYLRTYDHIPFQKGWHAKKLINSIREMKIETDFNEGDFLLIIDKLFMENKRLLKDGVEYGIKTLISGGVNNIPTIIMYLEEFDDIYSKLRETGVSLLAKRVPRQQAYSKNVDYRALMSAHRELEEKKCLEILHRGDIYVYESGTSNLFILKDRKVLTASDGIYKGSTRAFVIDLMKENNIEFEERYITWEEFSKADEVFITASKKEILPVIKIYNNKEILEFPIGKTTQKLINLFKKKKLTKLAL